MFRILKRSLSGIPELPKCDFKPSKYTGPTYDELRQIRRNHLNPVLTTYYSKPIAFHQGFKQWLFDLNGKRYLDMFGGICTVSVGHAHPRITKAVSEQIGSLGHVSNLYLNEKIHEYAVRLTDKFPGDLKVAYFVNSDSEANDLAVLIARAYTNNFELVTLKNSYHGMTYQTMGLCSNITYKYPVPQMSGVHTTMNPDVYRGPWGGSFCRDSPVQTSRKCDCPGDDSSLCVAKNQYIDQLEDVFKFNIKKNGQLAAFFAESIQGVGGTVQYPKNYLKEAYAIVKEAGGLFVSDEVQTGFGRTGEHFWGFEMHGIQPDIVTMAKGIGNGFPLAAVVTTPPIAAALSKASHFNTFGGNPVSCAAGIAVLDIIEDEKLQQNSANVGTYLLLELEKLKSKFSVVGDVRGKGLMIGVELVNGDGTKNPLQIEKFMKFWQTTSDMGLIIGKGGVHGNVLRIKPPMCVTKEDADFTVRVIESALSEIN